MPVVLERDTWDEWLDPDLDDPDELLGLLRPSPPGTLEHYRVSKDVGKGVPIGAGRQ